MKIEDALKMASEVFEGEVISEKTIETTWGWVFFSNAKENGFSAAFVNKYKNEVLKTRSTDIEQKIKIYTEDVASDCR